MTAQTHTPSLTGPHPGQLDKTQPQRVLRHPDARLSFASFHPQTASNVPPYNPLEGSSNPKRIVIETHPGGFSHWRFVPRARLAEDVSDEGSWPRLVDVLGYAEFVCPRIRLLTCISPQSPRHLRPGPVGYTQARSFLRMFRPSTAAPSHDSRQGRVSLVIPLLFHVFPIIRFR